MQNIRLSRNVTDIYKHKDPLLAQNLLCKFVYIQLCSAELLDSGAIMIKFHENTRLEMQIQSLGTYVWNTCLQYLNVKYPQFCNTISIINPVVVWARLFPSFQMLQV